MRLALGGVLCYCYEFLESFFTRALASLEFGARAFESLGSGVVGAYFGSLL